MIVLTLSRFATSRALRYGPMVVDAPDPTPSACTTNAPNGWLFGAIPGEPRLKSPSVTG